MALTGLSALLLWFNHFLQESHCQILIIDLYKKETSLLLLYLNKEKKQKWNWPTLFSSPPQLLASIHLKSFKVYLLETPRLLLAWWTFLNKVRNFVELSQSFRNRPDRTFVVPGLHNDTTLTFFSLYRTQLQRNWRVRMLAIIKNQTRNCMSVIFSSPRKHIRCSSSLNQLYFCNKH